MSLRYQISIRILLISFFILVLGGTIAIWQARNSINNEVDSSINLTLQLIKISIESAQDNKTDWASRLSRIEQTRHLNIQLKKPSGIIVDITKNALSDSDKDRPPQWFAYLVESDYPKVEYKIETQDNRFMTLIIQANPMDEMTEAWEESIAFFSSILLLVLLTFISVHLVFNKTLQAIKTIIENLQAIEKGNYNKKLPDFSTLEYDSIAKAINHMTVELDTSQRQNQALTQHSLKIQEEERQHLSQELHDEFGQSLTAIKVMAVSASHENADTPAITQSIVEICDHLMVILRSMMKQLHPLILTELGLKATLEDLLNHWQSRAFTTSFDLQVDDAVDSLNKTITIQVFRVIQESLTNIIRHANAKQVTISLKINAQKQELDLFISDNGQGCDLPSITSGFGLQGIAERIKLLNGEFQLQSHANEGLQITAKIPIVD
ncbi:MAG: LapD/MoxY N-terminal periplasmic domain-containing protein [Methyloprofundus sp.]|nr:LapD/MoxY N-terminal periplasmic domain-containing protein [Methyloprofundus sp.]